MIKLYDTTSSCKLPSSFDQYTGPVGQLVELGAKCEIIHRFCTGFNINGGAHFLTAGHCTNSGGYVCDVADRITAGRCFVNFNYEMCGLGIDDTRIKSLQKCVDGCYHEVKRTLSQGFCGSESLDYCILQLDPTSGKHGSLGLSSEKLAKALDVLLVHHSEGHPKQYSTGQISDIYPDMFSYSANTMKGSSGAPVISCKTGGVIGVHVIGDEFTQQGNSATMISSIVKVAHQAKQSWVVPQLQKFGLGLPSSRLIQNERRS